MKLLKNIMAKLIFLPANKRDLVDKLFTKMKELQSFLNSLMEKNLLDLKKKISKIKILNN